MFIEIFGVDKTQITEALTDFGTIMSIMMDEPNEKIRGE